MIHSLSRCHPCERGTGYFHLHLVSDATGETLITVARAAAAQYAKVPPVEHLLSAGAHAEAARPRAGRDRGAARHRALYAAGGEPGRSGWRSKCRELSVPCLSILGPVLRLFQSYLGAEPTHRVGAQHTLNAEYFKRIDALNYTMLHDDGQHIDDLEEADVVLVGVSRTSKTPTSIYLANRGVKTGNVPLVPGVPLPPQVEDADASAGGRALRQPRAHRADPAEPAARPASASRRRPVYRPQGGGGGNRVSRKLCAKHNWPIDRRDAPLDRGNRRRRDARCLPSAAGSRRREPMALWLADQPLVLASRSDARRAIARRRRHPGRDCARPISTSARSRRSAGARDPGAVARAAGAGESARGRGAACRAGWCSAPTRRWRSAAERFSKPADRAAARAQLQALARPHP